MLQKTIELKNQSSFRIGGVTHSFAEPLSYQELLSVLQIAEKRNQEPCIFGFGSNLLFSDKPSKDLFFISLKKMNRFSFRENLLVCQSGFPLSLLAVLGMLLRTDRFDFTYLLPGSIGAGLYINARYFDKEVSGIVTAIDYLDLDDLQTGIKTIPVGDCRFGYKESVFQKKRWIIVSASFSLPREPKIDNELFQPIVSLTKNETDNLITLPAFQKQITGLRRSISNYLPSKLGSNEPDRKLSLQFEEIEKHRQKYRHFSYASAGSVFKNMRELGKPVGQIIDELGLKCARSGEAMISPYHGNIIINLGSAKAFDVLKLIDKIQETVFKAYGVNPILEITIK